MYVVDAEPLLKVTAEPMVFQLPAPILTWNVADPEGVVPRPETVTDNDSEVPTVVEVGMLKVGAGTEAEPAATVKDDAALVAVL
jgi:hypothetical protein